jgi:hypothetical protein
MLTRTHIRTCAARAYRLSMVTFASTCLNVKHVPGYNKYAQAHTHMHTCAHAHTRTHTHTSARTQHTLQAE